MLRAYNERLTARCTTASYQSTIVRWRMRGAHLVATWTSAHHIGMQRTRSIVRLQQRIRIASAHRLAIRRYVYGRGHRRTLSFAYSRGITHAVVRSQHRLQIVRTANHITLSVYGSLTQILRCHWRRLAARDLSATRRGDSTLCASSCLARRLLPPGCGGPYKI